jgi:hypothetical protein
MAVAPLVSRAAPEQELRDAGSRTETPEIAGQPEKSLRARLQHQERRQQHLAHLTPQHQLPKQPDLNDWAKTAACSQSETRVPAASNF